MSKFTDYRMSGLYDSVRKSYKTIVIALIFYPHKFVQNGMISFVVIGVDDTTSIVLNFKNNRMAQLLITATSETPCRASICGTKGRITVSL